MSNSQNKENKKYKIFGINIIDLLALVIIIAAAAFLVYKFTGIGKSSVGTSYEITYQLDEVSDFVADHLVLGCALYDDTNAVDLGICTGFETAPSITYGANSDGEFVRSSRERYLSLVLTGEVMATETENGIEVAGQQYCIGDFIVLRAGDAKLYISIYNIKALSE